MELPLLQRRSRFRTHMDYVTLEHNGQGNVDMATHTNLIGALHLDISLTGVRGWWQGDGGRGHLHSDPI